MKMRYQIIALAIPVLAVGCRTGPETADYSEPNPSIAYRESGDMSKTAPLPSADFSPSPAAVNQVTPPDDKERFLVVMESRLNELDTKINDLAQKSDALNDEVKDRAIETLAALHERQDQAKTKLEEAKQASPDEWKLLKGGVEVAVNALGRACENARAIFY